MRKRKSAIGTAAHLSSLASFSDRTCRIHKLNHLDLLCSNRLKQEKEQMKESTTHLQKRVRMLEDHNRTLLEFGQDCAKRLLRLEAENGWEPPEVDFASTLDTCVSDLGPAEQMATSADSADQCTEGGGEAQDPKASSTLPSTTADESAASETSSSAPDAKTGVTSLDHSTGVHYIYQVGLLGIQR